MLMDLGFPLLLEHKYYSRIRVIVIESLSLEIDASCPNDCTTMNFCKV